MTYNWFAQDFHKFFVSDEKINLSPSFSFSYKLNNKSNFAFGTNSPIKYTLNSDETDSNDLYFISRINEHLTRTYIDLDAGDNMKFNLKLISESWMGNKPETNLYVQAGLNKEFYEKNKSSIKIKSSIDNLAKYIIITGIKEDRELKEAIFSYNFLKLLPFEQLSDKHLSGSELRKFLCKIR